MPSHPSPRRAARRSAARDSPPTRIGGHGRCRGFGSNATSSNAKNSPWCVTVSSDQRRRQTSIASSTRRPRVAKSRPAASHSWRNHDAPTPNSKRPAERMSTVCTPRASREGMAQSDVEHVGSEADALRLGGEECEVRERVVDRSVGRNRRMVLARIRRTRHRAREHEVLGQPDRFVAEAFGGERGVEMEVRVERAQRDTELHRAPSTTSPAVVNPPALLRPQPPAARLPPSTWIVVPVTKRDQSDAR